MAAALSASYQTALETKKPRIKLLRCWQYSQAKSSLTHVSVFYALLSELLENRDTEIQHYLAQRRDTFFSTSTFRSLSLTADLHLYLLQKVKSTEIYWCSHNSKQDVEWWWIVVRTMLCTLKAFFLMLWAVNSICHYQCQKRKRGSVHGWAANQQS